MRSTTTVQPEFSSDRGRVKGAARIDHSSSRGPRAWAARRPVTAFLLLLFSIGYPVMGLVALAQHDVIPGGGVPAFLGVDAEKVSSLLMVFLALLPAALWVTWAVDGAVGVRVLLRRAFQWRFPAHWWLIALLGMPTLTIAIALALGDTLRPVDMVAVAVEQAVGLLVGLFLVNLWEETAWAGFMQARLERRHSIITAAALTAVPFALIHMPLQFLGAFSLESLAGSLILLTIIGVVFRLLLGVVLRGARESVFAVALMHTMFNRSNNSDGIVAALVNGQARVVAALVAMVVLTIAITIGTRRRLTRAYRLDQFRTG